MKKIIFCIFLFVIFILLFNALGFPFWDTIKSYGIMSLYDEFMLRNTYLYKQGIDFYIPSGRETPTKDWYPLMLHYDASQAFSSYTGKNLSLVILYSFGAFDFLKGSSSFYNPFSPYYGAFYGGYAIFNHEASQLPYGFDSVGKLNIAHIQKAFMYDQTKLVVPSIGAPSEHSSFEVVLEKITYEKNYIEMKGWTQIDASIKTHAPIHQYKNQKHLGYIQYGKPHKSFYQGKDYPMVNMKGRIYVKYIEEFQGTFFLYIMAKDQKTIEECDAQLLSKAYIKYKN